MKTFEVISWGDVAFDSQEVKIKPITENNATKEIRILMPKDSIMKQHQAPFPISVQVLRGGIWFEVEGKSLTLKALDMITLQANIPHSLGGLQDSIVRLSLAKSDSIERVNAVLSNKN